MWYVQSQETPPEFNIETAKFCSLISPDQPNNCEASGRRRPPPPSYRKVALYVRGDIHFSLSGHSFTVSISLLGLVNKQNLMCIEV